ncbi:MAG: phosphoribosylanthranilate isomerase [Flavobacterium sp.]|nr:MAG: phosphoribosylanthranilate isomerase [Flavobacterium sp.]
MKIKVCGMKHKDNIQQLGALLPDYMGFIFYKKSSRFVGNSLSEFVLKELPKSIKKVGIFVNETLEYVQNNVEKYHLDFAQLHGNESVDYCRDLKQKGIKVIKAFQMDTDFDFKEISSYKEVVNYFLFDTKSSGYGGSGEKFNWELLQQYDNEIPIFLSGGISLEDASVIKNNPILKNINIECIDINSRFETAPAMKNISLISEFKKQLQNEF